jgi:hypothetical protein
VSEPAYHHELTDTPPVLLVAPMGYGYAYTADVLDQLRVR